MLSSRVTDIGNAFALFLLVLPPLIIMRAWARSLAGKLRYREGMAQSAIRNRILLAMAIRGLVIALPIGALMFAAEATLGFQAVCIAVVLSATSVWQVASRFAKGVVDRVELEFPRDPRQDETLLSENVLTSSQRLRPVYRDAGLYHRGRTPTLAEGILYAVFIVPVILSFIPFRSIPARPSAAPSESLQPSRLAAPTDLVTPAELEAELENLLPPSPTEQLKIAAGDFRSIARATLPSIVSLTVENTDGTTRHGSGFFLRHGDSLAIVTNAHVIRTAKRVRAQNSKGESFEVPGFHIAGLDADLVVLECPARDESPLELAPFDTLEVGERVAVIGSPLGLRGTLTEGIVSAQRAAGTERELVQLTAPVSPGSSGSPVLNSNGQVVAVIRGGIAESQGLNFAVPARILRALLAFDLEAGDAPKGSVINTAGFGTTPFWVLTAPGLPADVGTPASHPTAVRPRVVGLPAEETLLRLLVEHPDLKLPQAAADRLKQVGLSSSEGQETIREIIKKVADTGDANLVRLVRDAIAARDAEAARLRQSTK